MLITLGAILVLLLLSAFFSGSETALTAASRPLMHQLENNGNRRARMINRLNEHQERLIGAILLGNNLVNILASALATSVMIALYGEAGVAYATLIMTLLVLIFAEILPKTYAIKNADSMSLKIIPTVNALVLMLAPITRSINFLVHGVLKIFQRNSTTEDLGTSSEELRGAIELHADEDRAVDDERAMLRSVLDLAEVQVGEIMAHRKDVTMIDADQPADKVVDEVLASPFTRIPLWQGQPENIVGVLHAKALLRAVKARDDSKAKKPDEINVISLAAKPWFIPEQTTLLDQLQEFRKRHEHFALMVNEYGSFMGIVTLEDILEEIVGEITDEFDEAEDSNVAKSADGHFIVEGGMTIRDFNRATECQLPDEEANTVAGLVIHESQMIPTVGQVFSFHGFRFEVTERDGNRITELKMRPLQSTPSI